MNQLGQRMEQHKRLICSGFLVLLTVVFFLYGALRISGAGYPDNTKGALIALFLGAGVLGVGLMVLLYWLSFHKTVRIERLFLISGILLSLAYMLFFAPVSVPDEQAHYITAYRLSNLFLFRFDQIGNQDVLIRATDAEFFGYFDGNGILDGEKYRLLLQHFSWFAGGNTGLETYSYDAVTNVPLGYVASALGIAVGRLLHLGGGAVFYLGRIFNMAQYITLAYVAMRRIPFGKTVLFVISLFPMTLHLCASYSYDCMIIGVSMCFVAEIVRMIYGDSISHRQIIFCAVMCFVLAPSKLVYTPLLFLVLLIPGDKLKNVFPRPNLLKALLILVGVLGLFIGQLNSMASYVGEDAGAYISWAGEEGYSLSWVLQNPIGTVLVFLNTVLYMTDFYFSSLLGGSLGWLQISVPYYFCLPFAALFCLACLRKREEVPGLGFLSKCWVFLLILGSSGLILASMFLSWTPITSSTILGVQGRYFLPLLPAVFLLLRGNGITINSSIDRHIIFLSSTLNILVLAYSFLAVFGAI